VYHSNILNKRKLKVVHHILASNYIFDLSYANTFKLKKNIIRAAFQNNFCRGLVPFSNEASLTLIKKAKIQTVLLALHCSKSSVKLLEKPSLFKKDKISKVPGVVNSFSSFLGLKTKSNTLPYFFGKKACADFLTLDSKLNNLPVFYKQKKQVQNKRNLLKGILKKKLTFSPRMFTKVISEVFNKAIRKSCMRSICPIKKSGAKTGRKQEEPPIASFKKSQKSFFNSKASLWNTLVFNMKNQKNSELKATDVKHILERETRWLTVAKSASPLAHQKRGSSQAGAAYSGVFKRSESCNGYLVRANWILSRFIEQLSKKKMNPRSAMSQQINDIRVLIDKMGSECPIKGMRITITGRLGSRKKAMAQQVSKCVGKVPLSTFRQRVDYRQGVLPTKFGLIGIKIWVCYAITF
jgi:hypothetical protein